MKPRQTHVVVLPLQDILKHIQSTHRLLEHRLDCKGMLELLVVLWLKDQHCHLQGEWLTEVFPSDEGLVDHIRVSLMDLLVEDDMDAVEQAAIPCAVETAADLLFPRLERCLVTEAFERAHLTQARVQRWYFEDLVVEFF